MNKPCGIQLATALALDTQHNTLATIIETSSDANLIACLQMNLVRTVIGDILACHIREGDEIAHVVLRYREIILFIRKGGLTDVETITTEPDDLTHIQERTTQENKASNSRHQRTLTPTTLFLYLIPKGYKALMLFAP